MDIVRIPVLFDNYVFILHDPVSRTAAVVDPAIAPPISEFLTQQQAQLVAIFNTHHHSDHVGGNPALRRQFPDVCIYGGEHDRGRIPGQQIYLQEGDRVTFAGRDAQVFFVPGHTRAHIAYYFAPVTAAEPGDLFCGDTLFAGGCGRLFEGTPAQMVNSLTKLRQLPETTRIWCAHEYTLKNLQFALTVEPDNLALKERFHTTQIARQYNEPTVPTVLAVEKQTNPFLRWDVGAIQATVQGKDAIETFAQLRRRKDRF